MIRLRLIAALLLLGPLLAATLAPAPLRGQQPSPGAGQSAQAQGGVGFVQLVVNDQQPIAFFPAWIDADEQPYLAFDPLMQALEVPVSFDPSLGAAGGFLADGATRFELNLERGTVVVGALTHELEPADYRLVEQTLYVHHRAVERWVPANLSWSVAAYQVRVRTRYPLPSEQRATRAAHRRAVEEARADAPTAAELEREVPWFDPGMFEATGTARGGHGFPDETLLNLKGVHRFLKGDLEYSATQSRVDGETRDATLDYGRLTYYDPLRTWQVQLGDTFSGFSPLVLDTVSFRGGSFHTGGRQLRFGRTALIGTAPPGSEVDLYRQGVLLDFTVADDQGFYRFENVPLTLETTLFEVQIFTPRGEKRVEFQQVAAQEEMLGAGALGTLGAVGRGDQGLTRFGIAGGEARYGLFPRLTVGGYALQLEDYDAGYETITELNAAGAIVLGRPAEWLVLLAEQAQDADVPGSGTRLGAFLAFRPLALELEQRRYEAEFAPPKRTRSTLFSEPDRVDTVNTAQVRTRVWDTNLELESTLSDFGQTRTLSEQLLRVDRRLGTHISAFLTLTRQRTGEAAFPTGGFDEQQALTTYRLGTLERLELQLQQRDVVADGTRTLARASWLKNQIFGSPWAWELSYLARNPEDDLAIGVLGYLFPFNLRLTGRVQSDGHWLAQVDYTVPFRVTGEGMERVPYGTYGRAGLAGEVYLDANANGVREPGEGPVQDVTLLAPGIPELRTDAQGRFRGWGLPAREPVAVGLDLLSTDALYTPARKRQYIAPRPGEEVRMEFALVPSSGMDGRLVHAGPAEISPAEGLEMVLIGADGAVESRATVEWDGAFIFEDLRPGTYTLQADAEAFAAHGLALQPEAMEVSFPPGPDPAWLSGVELRLVEEAEGAR